MSFWLRESNSKSVDRRARVDPSNSSTLRARVGLNEMPRKDWMSERSAVNVLIAVWTFGVSLGSAGWIGFVVLTGVRVDLMVMVFVVCSRRDRSGEWILVIRYEHLS